MKVLDENDQILFNTNDKIPEKWDAIKTYEPVFSKRMDLQYNWAAFTFLGIMWEKNGIRIIFIEIL